MLVAVPVLIHGCCHYNLPARQKQDDSRSETYRPRSVSSLLMRFKAIATDELYEEDPESRTDLVIGFVVSRRQAMG